MNKSEEVIYKQTALDAIAEMQIPIMRSKSETDQLIFKGLGMAWSAIDELDPAQLPERRIAEIKIDKGDLEKLVIEKISKAQKTGYWIQKHDVYGDYYECSECECDLPRVSATPFRLYNPYPEMISLNKTAFCPNCGAKME